MLDVRFLCPECHKLSGYRPVVTNDHAIEPLSCMHCESYIGDFVFTPDKDMKE